jgi:multiple sugar transport system substrate-binding protein
MTARERHDLTRRNFLGLSAAAVGGSLLAACGGGSASGGGNSVAFWDMPWGAAAYPPAAQALTEAYRPANGLPSATYQNIPWNNFVQTFSSAVASSTGPAVSTGGGFQAFQFAEQGAIAYADNVIKTFESDGTIDDFLPGTVESMRTPAGYVAVPWQLDMRVWWYRKSSLDEAGVAPPTNWDELLTAGRALAQKGMYGFGTGTGPGAPIGAHTLIMMMINNGGGIFAPDGTVDLVTDRNIEAMTFVQELVRSGIVDPGTVSYTRDNIFSQWKNKKFAMGIDTAGLNADTGDTTGDLLVMSPLTGPHGDTSSLYFVNNIMMYTNTPSPEGSEAFLTYFIKNMKTLWQQNLMPGLPVLESIVALPEFQQQTQKVKVIQEYQPVAKSNAALSTQLTARLAQIDGGDPLTQFTQTMFAGQTDPRTALTTFQTALSSIVK